MGELGIAEEDRWRRRTAQGGWRSDEGMMISRKKRAMMAGQGHKARGEGSRETAGGEMKEIVDERLETVELGGGENYSGDCSSGDTECPGNTSRRSKESKAAHRQRWVKDFDLTPDSKHNPDKHLKALATKLGPISRLDSY